MSCEKPKSSDLRSSVTRRLGVESEGDDMTLIIYFAALPVVWLAVIVFSDSICQFLMQRPKGSKKFVVSSDRSTWN